MQGSITKVKKQLLFIIKNNMLFPVDLSTQQKARYPQRDIRDRNQNQNHNDNLDGGVTVGRFSGG